MIRWASVADAEGMARVHVASWEGAYRGLMPDEVIDGLSVERRTEGWSRALTEPRPKTAAFVAEHGVRSLASPPSALLETKTLTRNGSARFRLSTSTRSIGVTVTVGT